MRFLLVLAGPIALTLQALASEEAILQIWHRFVASAVAYERCGSNDAALQQKFAANFLAVASQAAEQVRMEHPFDPAGDLVRAMEGQRKAVKVRVEDEISKNGCASEGIKELLKLYEANANLDGNGK